MTTKYSQRQILLVNIAYSDDPEQSKKRPAVVISPLQYNQTRRDLIILPITSNLGAQEEGDVSIKGALIQACGLKHPCIVKVGNPFTASPEAVIRILGIMPNSLFNDTWQGFLHALGIERK